MLGGAFLDSSSERENLESFREYIYITTYLIVSIKEKIPNSFLMLSGLSWFLLTVVFV